MPSPAIAGFSTATRINPTLCCQLDYSFVPDCRKATATNPRSSPIPDLIYPPKCDRFTFESVASCETPNRRDVPEADVVEQFVPASGATPAGRRWSALMTPG
jgi:hypothetical protein